MGQGRLAGPGRADDREPATGGQLEFEPGEGGLLRSWIGELESADFDCRWGDISRNRGRPCRIFDRGTGVEDGEDSPPRCELLREVPGGGRQRLHRLEGGHRHQAEDGQPDTVEKPCPDHRNRNHEHDPHRGVGRKGHGGCAESFDPRGPFAISDKP